MAGAGRLGADRPAAASQAMLALFYRGLSPPEIDAFESTLRRIIANLEEALD